MSHSIKLKNIPPTLTMTLKGTYTYPDIQESSDTIHSIAVNNSDSVLICLGENTLINNDTSFTLCFPFKEVDYMSYNSEDFFVLQRTDVLSLLHVGEYDNLNSELEKLYKFALDNELTPKFPYRIIYQKTHSKLFLNKNHQYSIEIQLPVV